MESERIRNSVREKEDWHGLVKEDVLYSNQHGADLSVIFIDMDRFKEINDTLGLDIGDQVIADIKDFLLSLEGMLSGHIGGDEFAIACRVDYEGAQEIKKYVEEVLREYVQKEENKGLSDIGVEPSIGIATHEYGQSASDLLRKADKDMYKQKREKLNFGRRQKVALFIARFAMQKIGGIRLRDIGKYETLVAQK